MELLDATNTIGHRTVLNIEQIDESADWSDVSKDGVITAGVGTESANAETPQISWWKPGDIVDFTDSGDGSGTGLYLMKPDGSWVVIS